MVQTVLGGSAVAVHREGHRNFCPDAGGGPSGSNDARIHCCNTLTRRSMSLLSGVERAPQAHVVWKTGGKRRNPVHSRNSERSLGDTETDADQPEDPEDW